ncbi:sigma factor [Oceanobacillus halophilus]|uniref:RNA polymerase sigma-70 region 2 domain-containing protein n=1 Tax=Oceanobacillus halophilus TaxID=930130 RepID=A0A495A3S5_9BACI|nr:sigma factor [Oceanobacillus halophilus]RKQ33999.1 hypothetical protein D8M06_09270 [Oceanobacillus halophilus]
MREIRLCIIKQVKKGNRHAFKKLVQHYHQAVYRLCYILMGNKQMADDLAYDTFLHVYSHIHDYPLTNQKFSLWLYQLTIDLAQVQMDEEDFNEVSKCFLLEKCPEADIQGFLMHVSMKERLALILKSSNHLSIQEISEVLNTSKTETLTYLRQGREMLRDQLNQCSV